MRGVSARQCKDFLPTVDSANRPWPTWRHSAVGFFPVGQRAARSLPERWPAVRSRGRQALAVQGYRLALGGAARAAAPFKFGGIVDGHSTQARTKRIMRIASFCAHLLHGICIGCSKLFHRTRATGVGEEGDWSATDRGLLLLCTNVIRLDATNNGRPQHGNGSGSYGLPNRRIEPSSI